MTDFEKLAMLKSFLNISGGDQTQDALLSAYLSFAQAEIVNWRYGGVGNTKLVKAEFDDDYGKASVDASVFIGAMTPTNGTYAFTYSADSVCWQFGGEDTDLEVYGITYSGLDPVDGDVISVTYNDRYLAQYEMVQIMACVTGFNLIGVENQVSHSENGISRTFKYSDAVDYIHAHVQPIVGVI